MQQTQTNPAPNMKAFGFLQHTQSSELRNNLIKLERDGLETQADNEKLVKAIPNVVPAGHYLAQQKERVTCIRQISPTKVRSTKSKEVKSTPQANLLQHGQES